jgi:O-antigen ligase/polysaccharide polymerase Wzy-like membrane protein
VSRHVTPWVRRAGWQSILAVLAFVQIAGAFTSLADRLYVAKQMAALGIGLCFFLLGRCRISRELTTEFALVIATVGIGLVSQLGDTIDGRALGLAASYSMTAFTAFLIAPSAFRRRSVHRIVWPALLLGVTVGVVIGEYLGAQDIFASFSFFTGRLRFAAGFYSPNAAGVAGLVGVILAVAAFEARRRWVYLAPVPVFIAVMLLGDSRGAILAAIAFLVAIPILRIARWPPRRVAIALSLGLVGCLLIGSVLAPRINWPAPGQFGPDLNRLSSGRWTNWQEALSYLDGPLPWIFGLGMSRNLSFAYQETDFPVPVRGYNADNFFVDIVGRAGIVGLVLMLAVLWSLALKMWRGLTLGSPRSTSRYVLGLAAFTSTVLLGQTNSIIFTWAWLQAIVAWPLVAAAATHAGVDARARAPGA